VDRLHRFDQANLVVHVQAQHHTPAFVFQATVESATVCPWRLPLLGWRVLRIECWELRCRQI
jgi:hypothetical protein